MTVSLSELMSYLNDLLKPDQFEDYCPNGLQVEGKPRVTRLVSGVTASQALLDRAIKQGADAILVHHGYFWKGDDSVVTGMLKSRLKALLDNDVSLIAYHLPLDAHAEFGNNVGLAKVLELEVTGGLDGEIGASIGLVGRLAQSLTGEQFAAHIQSKLARPPLHIGNVTENVETLAWCTGAAQGYIEKAAAAGVDAFLTGEVSEQTVHIARELGIHFYAAGHHATERFGVQLVGEQVAQALGIEHQFIDIDNPV